MDVLLVAEVSGVAVSRTKQPCARGAAALAVPVDGDVVIEVGQRLLKDDRAVCEAGDEPAKTRASKWRVRW